ncbi:MAG TPA: prolipoprotein diacylglyceryl transferase [Phycisphaerae bacterium]|nr:prolipoprotein diacylglyceryl transferase [Phycisphaerae bacterium]
MFEADSTDMRQVIVDFGQVGFAGLKMGLRIYGYGLMLVLGFGLGILLARWRARRMGESPETASTLGLLALVGGVAGSRLAYVIERWDSHFSRADDTLAEIFNVSSGGLIYYGGVVLAVVLIVGYLAAKRMPIRRYLDIITPSLMIGLAFGRMGCLLNGCCYGGHAHPDFALGMRFPYAAKPLVNLDKEHNAFGGAAVCPAYYAQAAGPPAPHDGPLLLSPQDLPDGQVERAAAMRTVPLQPAQAYGIVNALLIGGILLGYSRLRRREGTVFLLMLILYPITRFVLESIRGDNPHSLMSFQLTHNQYTSIGTVVLGMAMWALLRAAPASCGAYYAQRLTDQPPRSVRSGRARKGRRR